MKSSPETHWLRQIATRIGVCWPLKSVGTSLFMALFFVAYFAVLQTPFGPGAMMPLTWLDARIPFAEIAFPVYVSLWVYVSLPPALMSSLRSLLWFGVWVGSMCLLCIAIFWFLPTAVPPADIDWALHPGIAMIKGIDAAGNACPSLHVASAVFSAFWLQRVLRNVGAPGWLQVVNVLHCLAILWSTVATRQHVVLDVVAGCIVGVLFAVASLAHVGRQVGPDRL